MLPVYERRQTMAFFVNQAALSHCFTTIEQAEQLAHTHMQRVT
jgi:hypothetical protein